jgi:O-antigen/teichoic acid export membrane protein
VESSSRDLPLAAVPLASDVTSPAPTSAPLPVPVIDARVLHRKARLGMLALGVRGVLMQLTVLGGDIYLRRRLEPSDFGIFAIVQFALALFMQFGDVGLASALIQQHEPPTKRQLASAWTLQMLVSLALTSALWLGAPLLLRFWSDMPPRSIWIFRALSINLLLTTLRLVPALLMERNLEYPKLSALDVILTGTYYIAAVTFASFGWGVMSLAAAILIQGACGVIGAYALKPWLPTPVLDRALLRPIVRYGVQFQMKNVVAFMSSAIAPVYAGRTLGQAQLGLINWGQSTAYFPLKLVEIMARISFPLYSRLRTDPEEFARSLERAVAVSAMGTLFFVGMGIGLGHCIVHVVYGDKWLPALPMFYVYAVGIAVGFIHPVVAPAIDALGKPQLNLRLMLGWTVAIGVLVSILTPRWGAFGFAIGYCVPMVIGNAIVIVVVRRLVPGLSLWPRVRALIVGSLSIALVGRFGLAPYVSGVLTFSAAVVTTALIFLAVVAALDRTVIREILALTRIRKPQPL